MYVFGDRCNACHYLPNGATCLSFPWSSSLSNRYISHMLNYLHVRVCMHTRDAPQHRCTRVTCFHAHVTRTFETHTETCAHATYTIITIHHLHRGKAVS